MANSLERLENQLQKWIEINADRIAGHGEMSSLAHALVSTMENHLSKSSEHAVTAPSGYIIHLNPDTFRKWESLDEWLSKLSLTLQQVAVENNISFRSKPFIRIQPDPFLTSSKMSVTVEEPSHIEDTATVPVTDLDKPMLDLSSLPNRPFLLVDGKTFFSLDYPIVNIGRQSDNTLVIKDPRVSRHHAQLRCINGEVVISDLNSTGGTCVNSIRITQQTLIPGDVIVLAGYPLIFGETVEQNQDENNQTRTNKPGVKK